MTHPASELLCQCGHAEIFHGPSGCTSGPPNGLCLCAKWHPTHLNTSPSPAPDGFEDEIDAAFKAWLGGHVAWCDCDPKEKPAFAAGYNAGRASRESEIERWKSSSALHYGRLSSILFSGHLDYTKCGEIQSWEKEYTNAVAENARLRAALEVAKGILWMAKEYAEAGGNIGPEMRDFTVAEEAITAALTEEMKG